MPVGVLMCFSSLFKW